MRARFTKALALGAAAIAMLGVAGCGDDDATTAGKGSITIGHQAFGESEILANVYGEALEADGYDVSYQSFKDRAAIYAALESGDIDLVPEYAASGLEFLNGNAGEASPDVEATTKKLETQLTDNDLASGAVSEAVDTNSLVVTKESSDTKGLTKISQLTDDLRLGGPQDCPSNASCLPALKTTYDIDLSAKFVPLDLGGPLTKAALEEGDIDVAVIFSTDSSIADKGWVVLEDDKGIFNADNVIPVGTTELVTDAKSVLDRVSAALTTAELTEMNKRYDIDKDDASDIAADYVAAEKLN